MAFLKRKKAPEEVQVETQNNSVTDKGEVNQQVAHVPIEFALYELIVQLDPKINELNTKVEELLKLVKE